MNSKLFLTCAKAIEWLMGMRLSLAPCTTNICFPINRLSRKRFNYKKLSWPGNAIQAGCFIGGIVAGWVGISQVSFSRHRICHRSCQCLANHIGGKSCKKIVWQKEVIVWWKKKWLCDRKKVIVWQMLPLKKRDIPVFHFWQMMIVTFIILS